MKKEEPEDADNEHAEEETNSNEVTKQEAVDDSF